MEFVVEATGLVYEASRPLPARSLRTGEYTVVCPRCDRRFADTSARDAEENRDRHMRHCAPATQGGLQ